GISSSLVFHDALCNVIHAPVEFTEPTPFDSTARQQMAIFRIFTSVSHTIPNKKAYVIGFIRERLLHPVRSVVGYPSRLACPAEPARHFNGNGE
ncbi:MAG: hypothetical protein VB875_04765, partial [Pirellulales bacterium]